MFQSHLIPSCVGEYTYQGEHQEMLTDALRKIKMYSLKNCCRGEKIRQAKMVWWAVFKSRRSFLVFTALHNFLFGVGWT